MTDRALQISGLALAVLFICVWWIERRRLNAKEIALVAAVAAIAGLSRVPFAALPSVQPTTFFVMAAGAAFGGTIGLTVGVIAALVSNFFLGHGPWTVFQMLGWGLCGLCGAAITALRPSAGAKTFAACGFVLGFLFGWLMNLWQWIAFVYPLTFSSWLALNAASAWFDALHAVTNLLLWLFIGNDVLSILRRFQKKLSFTYQSSST